MKRFRLILVILPAFIALAGFSWLGYNLYRKYQNPSESPFSAIPGNTALIIQLNKAGNLLGELNRSNLLWKTLSHFPGVNNIKNELNFLDSASRKNEEIRKLLHQQNILVAITMSGKYNFGTLYLTSVPGVDPESSILGFLEEINEGRAIITHAPYSVTQLHRVQSRQRNDAFYFAIMKGVFIGSFHADLVKRSIDRMSLNTPMVTSSGFSKVQAAAGKKVDANIYVNYRFFSLVLSKITRDDVLPELIKLSNFAEWSELDLIIKKDELLFNGTTVVSDSNQYFLSLFSDQDPQPREIAGIIPEDALYFSAFGWSNPARFCQRYQARAQPDEPASAENNLVSTLVDYYQLNVKEYFLPWMGNQGGIFAISRARDNGTVVYSAFQTKDTIVASSSLLALADTIGIKYDSARYRGHRIFRMELPPFLPALFGEIFGKSEASCFTFVNNYIIFAGQPKELEWVIDDVMQNRTLAYNKFYKDFEANLSDKSNVFSFFNTRRSLEEFKGFLSQDISNQMTPMIDSLRKFESVAIQYSNSEGQFYSNIFLRYNPNSGSEGPLQWQVQLDTTISGRPMIIHPTPDGIPAIVATDIANNLYLVTREGQIAWKLHIMGKVLGDVHTISMPGTDSIFLIFNTDTHLYLLRSDGTYADRFPMRFPINATNGIAVADWNGDHDYRILVAFQDNKVYNFTLDGISALGWKRPDLKEEITAPVTTYSVDGKNYILVSGNTGNTLILDRDGDVVINTGIKFAQAPISGFHLNKTNRQGPFLTTGPDGKIIFIRDNGKISQATLNFFSAGHRFFYNDITGNGQPEFIFSDRNIIYYYNRYYKLIYTYAFRRDVKEPPFLVNDKGGKVMIGYVVPETNELFLFDSHGYYELESGIHGNTPFDVGLLESMEQSNLVVGAGKFLKNYRLTKL